MSQEYSSGDPRKRSYQVAVGTAGPRGASFAVIAESWECPECRLGNPPGAWRCKRCRARRPAAPAATQDVADDGLAQQDSNKWSAAAASAATAAADATRWPRLSPVMKRHCAAARWSAARGVKVAGCSAARLSSSSLPPSLSLPWSACALAPVDVDSRRPLRAGAVGWSCADPTLPCPCCCCSR